ncbi:hypothetical protein AAMO2058_001460500 [Amorphochlora amoebiformis]
MKFGRKLIEMRISKWAPYYIDYQELKYILKSHLPKEQQTEDDEGEDEKLALDLEGKLDLKIRGVAVRKIAKKYSKITKQPVEKQVVSAVERVRKFMCPKRLYSLREEAERFLSSVSKSAYRKAFTSVV